MNTKKLHLEADRRCGAEELEKILEKLPIEVKFTGRLKARMGLGRIIYMEPESDWEVKSDAIHVERKGSCYFFEYDNQKYEIYTR